MLKTLVIGALLALCPGGTDRPAFGQAAEIPPGNTILEIEIVTPRMGGDVLAAQRWGQVFDKLGEGVRIRPPLSGDQPGVSEQIRGTFRFVKVVGVMDRGGKVAFPGRTFTIEQTDRLQEWLNELKVYGAQGSPAGQPLWGLSREQFERLFKTLAQPVEKLNSSGTLLGDIAQLPIPKELPVRLHSAVDYDPLVPRPPAGNVQVNGLSAGTAMAAILSQYELGFRPLRTPSGTLELVVHRLSDVTDPWPIGWDVDAKATPGQLAPSLFQIHPRIGLETQALDAALGQVAAATQLPIVVDYRRCREINVDATAVPVSAPVKRTAWGVVLRSALRVNRLTYTLRNDETGRVFLYVHPFERTRVQ